MADVCLCVYASGDMCAVKDYMKSNGLHRKDWLLTHLDTIVPSKLHTAYNAQQQ